MFGVTNLRHCYCLQEEVDAYSDGEWYHAVVEQVDETVSREGILPGAVVRSVGKWSARDKSVEEVVEHIRRTKERPLKIYFLISTSPNHCRRLTVRAYLWEHACVGVSVLTVRRRKCCGHAHPFVPIRRKKKLRKPRQKMMP